MFFDMSFNWFLMSLGFFPEPFPLSFFFFKDIMVYFIIDLEEGKRMLKNSEIQARFILWTIVSCTDMNNA